jgi:hypothetical protein
MSLTEAKGPIVLPFLASSKATSKAASTSVWLAVNHHLGGKDQLAIFASGLEHFPLGNGEFLVQLVRDGHLKFAFDGH